MTAITTRFELPREVSHLLKILAAIGGAVVLTGIFVDPARTWPNCLIAGYYLVGLGLAGSFFIAAQYVGKGTWSTAFRRVPEAMSTALLPVAGLLLLSLAFGSHTLYEWTHGDVVAREPAMQARSGWLSLPFFLIRAAIYLTVWIVFAASLVRTSRRQDGDGSYAHTTRNTRTSAVFLVAFALTFLGASFDWIMSLQPSWYSTIFGIYNFAGLFLNGLATMTVLIILLRRAGPFRGIVNDQHLHDLGKYILAFSTFWAYIWFSQYMLIWYANIPEETSFYLNQMPGGWLSLFILNFGLNWIIPFLTLLPRAAKRSEGVMLKVCVVLMIGHWLDLYLMVFSTSAPRTTPPFGVWELAPILGAVALFFLIVFRSLGRANLVPIKDPALQASLHHHL